MEEKTNHFNTLTVRDDLHLSSIKFPTFSKNTVTSEELNDYLRDQLEQIKHENKTLQQDLSIKEIQINKEQIKMEELRKQLENYEGCCNKEFTPSLQIASSKIIDLSKKLRDKMSEVEVYKAKCSKLENQLVEAKKMQDQKRENEKPLQEPSDTKKLQDKLSYTTNKWIEEKNLNLQLKHDLKRANKWLLQEVGDKFETLLSLNNGKSSWRGRAQIICDLQQKNLDLKEKLKLYEENNIEKTTHLSETSRSKYDGKVEMLNSENFELKSNHDDLKRKFDALKARYKVLENEYTSLKKKVATLTQIHDEDQQTVSKFMSQMAYYNEVKREDLQQRDEKIKILEQEKKTLEMDLIKERCLSENKSKELLQKHDDIVLLNKRIRSSRPPSSYVRRSENPETKILTKLEVERLRLLELTELHNTRLEEERNSHFKTQQLLRIEMQKCAKLEANLAKFQLDQNARLGYSSKISIPHVIEHDLNNKLELAEENIKALTTRLQTENMERKRDIQKFGEILKNCKCNSV